MALSEQVVLLIAATGAVFACLFAALSFYRPRRGPDILTSTAALQMMRSETDIIRASIDHSGRELRQELTQSFAILRDGIDAQVRAFGERLEMGVSQIDARTGSIAARLDDALLQLRTESDSARETLRNLIDTKLDNSVARHDESSKNLREELGDNFQRLGMRVSGSLSEVSDMQRERLENVTSALSELSGKLEKAQEGLRSTVEAGLEKMRADNAEKLEQMRVTVDEKLQGTLEQRLGASFKLVSDQLEQVFRGVGEMQTLASGVGDLKRVLSSVKLRGVWGEVSLGNILDQILAPEQYERNVEVRPGSNQRVEYAIKLPGNDEGDEIPLWIPIDAKFPIKDYESLVDASERGDVAAVEMASKALEVSIRNAAKEICDKYVIPPHSTDFGVLFLPTEGLFAEVIRRPGLIDSLQRDCRIVVTGPTTLMALLNSLRMGFRTLAIQKRSSDVWKVLGAVKTEFGKYGEVIDKVQKKLEEASKTIDLVSVRRRALDRQLRDVEALPEIEAKKIIDLASPELLQPEGDGSFAS